MTDWADKRARAFTRRVSHCRGAEMDLAVLLREVAGAMPLGAKPVIDGATRAAFTNLERAEKAEAEAERLRGTNLAGAEERLRALATSSQMSSAWEGAWVGAWVAEGPMLVRSVLLDLDEARARLAKLEAVLSETRTLVRERSPLGGVRWDRRERIIEIIDDALEDT